MKQLVVTVVSRSGEYFGDFKVELVRWKDNGEIDFIEIPFLKRSPVILYNTYGAFISDDGVLIGTVVQDNTK